MSTATKDQPSADWGNESWAPESPFLSEIVVGERESHPEVELSGEIVTPWTTQSESPFSRDSVIAEAENLEEAEAVNELLAELESEEFAIGIHELLAEAEQAIDGESASFGLSSEVATIDLHRRYERHFGALAMEAERMHTVLADGFASHELSTLGEAEAEALISRLAPMPMVPLSPAQEQFLSGLRRKLSKAVGAATRLARNATRAVARGASSLGKAVLAPLLRRLGALVKPLVRNVIRLAIGRLPAPVRHIAMSISRKIGSGEILEAEASEAGPIVLPGAESIQAEHDLRIAEALLVPAGMEQEHEKFLAGLTGEEAEGEDVAGPLHEATRQLAVRLADLNEGEDPRPAIQEFLPAALMALRPVAKMAIAALGRDRVINTLAMLAAKVISPLIGPKLAKVVAKPVIVTGFKAFNLEQAAEEDPRKAAAEVLAQTLQETVLSLAQQSPETLEQPELVQALALEAFENAAAANFPPETIRAELRENEDPAGGSWMLKPSGTRRKYYKKFSRVFEVTLDPGALRRSLTFGGASVADMLHATTGVDISKPIKANIHVYELTLGSRLMDISRLERAVHGLGSHRWSAWSRFMPLTPEVAAELLPKGMAGLGRGAHPAFLRGPYMVTHGQRFYFIELPGRHLPPAPSQTPNSQTAILPAINDVGIVINLARGAITTKLRLSESTAQEIAKYLRRRDIATPIQILRRAMGGLSALANGQLRVGVRVEGELEVLREHLAELSRTDYFIPAALGTAVAAAARKIIEDLLIHLGKKLVDLLWTALARYLANKSSEFIAATENPAHGVTVVVAFSGIDVLRRIGQARQGSVASAAMGFLRDRIHTAALPVTALPMPSISIHPGRI